MRICVSVLLLALSPLALGEERSELQMLRARSSEQERQIRTLEKEIEKLVSQLALERRRSRGVDPSAAPSSPLPSQPKSYEVKAGDTLSSISRKYQISTSSLMKTNAIEDPTLLRVGQKLVLPTEAKAAPTPNVQQKTPTAPSKIGSYQVQRGDTLYGIARKHKTSVAAIKTLNPKVKDRIIIGQTLVVSGTPHTVNVNTPSTKKQHTISTRVSQPVTTKSKLKKVSDKKKASASNKPKETRKKTSREAPGVSVLKEMNEKKSPPPATNTVSTVIVMEETTFGNFAKKHNTTVNELNRINGWKYQSDLRMARGSKVYVVNR